MVGLVELWNVGDLCDLWERTVVPTGFVNLAGPVQPVRRVWLLRPVGSVRLVGPVRPVGRVRLVGLWEL